MSVVACHSQRRNVQSEKLTKSPGTIARLHVADSTMPKSVHSTGNNTKTFADRRENAPANIPIRQWRANSRLKESAGSSVTDEVTEHTARLTESMKYIPLSGP